MSTMNPSTKPITEGQIGKIFEILGAALRKSKILSEPFQDVLKHQGVPMTKEILAVIQKYVDTASDMISRTVTVNRNHSGKEVIDATGRNQYVTDIVVAGMPKGEGEETEVVFFKLGRYVNDDTLEKEYELRGLTPDPYAQAAVNEADPAFADKYPNATHWKDKDGKWCFATFRRWVADKRNVRVSRHDNDFNDLWWFGGVRKSTVDSDASAS